VFLLLAFSFCLLKAFVDSQSLPFQANCRESFKNESVSASFGCFVSVKLISEAIREVSFV
jgi:hypothetical protein